MKIIYFAPIEWNTAKQGPQYLGQEPSQDFSFHYIKPLSLYNLRFYNFSNISHRICGFFRLKLKHLKKLFKLIKSLNNTIVFLSPFPNNEQLKDGYFQRIKAINDVFFNRNRIYFRYHPKSIRFFPHVTKTKNDTYEINIYLNPLHFLLQLFITFKAKAVYSHSILPLGHINDRILFGVARKKILDLHGVVPEEFMYHDDPVNSKKFNAIEAFAVKKATTIICVTHKMESHIRTKHSLGKKKKTLVIPVLRAPKINNKEKEHIPNSVIYCGGTQKWQQVGKMLNYAHQNKGKLHLAFLVPKVDEIKNQYFGLYHEEFPGIIESVEPYMVDNWYQKYCFGLVLREDCIVNQVACPTKIIEYMQNDIVPIVDTPNIGDLLDLGFAYVDYRKPLPNHEEWREMASKNREVLAKIYATFDAGITQLRKC